MNNLYQKQLLEIYAEKPNFGELKEKTHSVSYKNPICNDEIVIDLIIQDDIVKDARFRGVSCFVSTISASVILDKIKGMNVRDITRINPSEINKWLGTEIIPTRIACELLPLEALKKLGGSN